MKYDSFQLCQTKTYLHFYDVTTLLFGKSIFN